MDPSIAVILEVLKTQVTDLRLVVLFGSFASGHQRHDSDIDIGFAATRGLEGRTLFDLKLTIQAQCERNVDLIDLTNPNISIVLKHEVISTGVVIFESNDSIMSEFQARILRDYEDFMYRRRSLDNALANRLGAYAHA